MKAAALVFCLLASPIGLSADDAQVHDHEALRAQLETLDGEVVKLDERVAEGGLKVVAAMLRTTETPTRVVEVLLAPVDALREAGVVIEPGDRLRVRAFPADEGPLYVHRLWNLTHRGEARLRTLRRDPVWNGDGDWQGKAAEYCPYGPPAEPPAPRAPPPPPG